MGGTGDRDFLPNFDRNPALHDGFQRVRKALHAHFAANGLGDVSEACRDGCEVRQAAGRKK
jgi:hypothetical protein